MQLEVKGFVEEVSLRSFLGDSSYGALQSSDGRAFQRVGGCHTEGSVPKGLETGTRDRKQSHDRGLHVWVQQARQVSEGFVSRKKDFVNNVWFYWKPVEIYEGGGVPRA